MRIVEDLETLKEGYIAEEGDIAGTFKENKMYIYHNDSWEEYKPPNGELKMNLYDINANIIEQLGQYNDEKIKEAISIINDKYHGAYYMMLCNDIRYYTVFAYNPYYCNEGESLGEAVISCATDVGPIYDISETEDGAFEIWVKDNTNTMRCLVLFNYEKGIVYYGEV